MVAIHTRVHADSRGGHRTASIIIGDRDIVHLSTGQSGELAVVDCVAGAVEPVPTLVLQRGCEVACRLVVLPLYESSVGLTVYYRLDGLWGTWSWRKGKDTEDG